MGMVKSLLKKARGPFFFVVACAGLYLAYLGLREKAPALTFDVVTESNVVDVHRALPDLEVRFQGEDIYGSGQNLRIITLRIANTGDTNILQSDFDQTLPWGFRSDSGRIIQVRLVSASSSYLERNVQPTLVDERTAELRKVIIGRGKGIFLELLVLHDQAVDPVITPFGKVAGIDEF